ncbi:MAG: hypothetical protein JXN63_08605 [Candidatus Delongbacteria bacterium]|nr:hypothetical protein [Candidatus Delongbacteria bacterium]
MKKIVAFVVVLALAFSLSAQFKTGMDFRTRAEMFCTSEDHQLWERITDLRFKPWLSYTQNEYLSAKFVMEIGDIGFGNAAKGGALGTDGINVETKNLFLDITPNNENRIRLGLQPYKDFHSMILDSDIAGLSWKNIYMLQGKQLTSFVAWFASADLGEVYEKDNNTYSLGKTEIVADFEYEINDKIKVGINNLAQFSREQRSDDGLNVSHSKSIVLWSTPYFAGLFNKFYVEAALGMNNIRPENEFILGDGDTGYNPQSTGGVFSLKTKYDINDEFDARFNFLFRDGDGNQEAGWNVYYGMNSYYDTGLEILTEKGYGLDTKDTQVFSPFTTFPKNPLAGHGGIILPAVFVDYNISNLMKSLTFINDFKLTFGLGHAMTAIEVLRKGSDWKLRPESWIGTELDLKAKIKMFDDLYVTPYIAVLLPGEWYDHEGGHKPFTKIGLSLNTKLK